MDLLQSVKKEGSRGGVNFSWDDVRSATNRESYLGHSLMAPVGRWQKNKDLNWYAKAEDAELTESERAEKERERKREELRKVKEAEEDAMNRAMGLPVKDRENANEVPLGISQKVSQALKEVLDDGEGEGEGGRGLGKGKGEDGKEGRRRRHWSRSRERRRHHGDDRAERRDWDGHRVERRHRDEDRNPESDPESEDTNIAHPRGTEIHVNDRAAEIATHMTDIAENVIPALEAATPNATRDQDPDLDPDPDHHIMTEDAEETNVLSRHDSTIQENRP